MGEDDDRLVAEALAELLRSLVGARPVVDQLVGAGVRRQSERADRADDRDDRDYRGDRLRRMGHRPLADPAQESPHAESFAGGERMHAASRSRTCPRGRLGPSRTRSAGAGCAGWHTQGRRSWPGEACPGVSRGCEFVESTISGKMGSVAKRYAAFLRGSISAAAASRARRSRGRSRRCLGSSRARRSSPRATSSSRTSGGASRRRSSARSRRRSPRSSAGSRTPSCGPPSRSPSSPGAALHRRAARRLRGQAPGRILGAVPSAGEAKEILGLATEEDLLELQGPNLHWLPSGGYAESDLDLEAVAGSSGPGPRGRRTRSSASTQSSSPSRLKARLHRSRVSARDCGCPQTGMERRCRHWWKRAP